MENDRDSGSSYLGTSAFEASSQLSHTGLEESTDSAYKIESLVEHILRILVREGFSSSRINYPREYSERSIDIFAVNNEKGVRLFLKIVDDFADITQSEIKDMRRLGEILSATPLVIARKVHGEELEDIVAYERQGVRIVNIAGFEKSLKNSIYVIYRQGKYYMRIDGEKLRDLRERRGLSLGDVAQLVGVSRRSVYLYERNVMDVSFNIALKLMDIFGDEIFKPINVFSERPYYRERISEGMLDTRDETSIFLTISRISEKAVHTRTTPIDIAAKTSEIITIILVDHYAKRLGSEEFEEKILEADKIARRYERLYKYALTRRKEAREMLEEAGFYVARSPEELGEIIASTRPGSATSDRVTR